MPACLSLFFSVLKKKKKKIWSQLTWHKFFFDLKVDKTTNQIVVAQARIDWGKFRNEEMSLHNKHFKLMYGINYITNCLYSYRLQCSNFTLVCVNKLLKIAKFWRLWILPFMYEEQDLGNLKSGVNCMVELYMYLIKHVVP